MKKMVLTVLLLSLLYAAFRSSAKSETDGIVVIETQLNYGTGFIIGNNLEYDYCFVITASHVVKSTLTPEIHFNTGEKTGALVIKRDTTKDLALLLVYNSPRKKPLRLMTKELPNWSSIHTIGHPDGLLYTRTTGMIQNNTREDRGASYYQLQLPIAPGASGSPVFYGKKVAGLLLAYQINMPTTSFAIQSSEIIEFLKKN